MIWCILYQLDHLSPHSPLFLHLVKIFERYLLSRFQSYHTACSPLELPCHMFDPQTVSILHWKSVPFYPPLPLPISPNPQPLGTTFLLSISVSWTFSHNKTWYLIVEILLSLLGFRVALALLSPSHFHTNFRCSLTPSPPLFNLNHSRTNLQVCILVFFPICQRFLYNYLKSFPIFFFFGKLNSIL